MYVIIRLVLIALLHYRGVCYQVSVMYYHNTDIHDKKSLNSTSATLKTQSKTECAIMKMVFNEKGFGFNKKLKICHLHWRCLTKYDTNLVEEQGWENYCEQFYAFHARVSKTTSGILRYDEVTLNIGNAFDQSDGIFTCKRDGVYIFIMSACTLNDLITGIWIERQGTLIFYSSVDAYYQDTSNWIFGSDIGIVIRKLVKGDRVYAELESGQLLGNFTTLSGWILTEERETVYAKNQNSGHVQGGIYKYTYVDESTTGSINKATGVFTAGDAGLYLFMSYVKSWNSESSLKLMSGSKEVVTIAPRGQAVVTYEMFNQSTAYLLFTDENFLKYGLGFYAVRIPSGIGFTVAMSSGLHMDDAFDKKLTDPYGLYNCGFHVKHTGLYFLSWTVMTEKLRFMTSYLTVNGEEREDCYSYNAQLVHTSTCFVLLQLNEGDVVNISRQNQSYSWNGEYMLFSGFLLSDSAK